MANRKAADAEYRIKNRDDRRNVISRVLGDKCVICDGTVNLAVHRKDGSTHEKFQWKSAPWVERELTTGLYVRLCYPCHKGVHWAMKHLGYTWDGIIVNLVS